ncbi:MAG TPA: XdhC family protein [Jatrophihabitans sp.]|nr:XdhC family protein [Jatrophihabitans sp.]
MYDIAPDVSRWLADGQDPTIAVVVAVRGFGTGATATAWAWLPDGSRAGRPLAGLDGGTVPDRGLVEVTVSDADAARDGLACGGAATLLVQRASDYPVDLWSRLADGEPVCLVTTTQPPRTQLLTPATIRDAGGDAAARLFGRGSSTAAVVADDPTRIAVALWPVPTIVVVGDGLIAAALRDLAALLGWPARITPQVEAAVDAIKQLRRSDAVVVLSHDRDVDGPALTAALRGAAGYVGGLGARHTQAARREWLTAHGVSADEQARVHGPAGLDIDAHTPGEIAVSIVAEFLATRAGSSGGALRDRGGPVHAASAPPH